MEHKGKQLFVNCSRIFICFSEIIWRFIVNLFEKIFCPFFIIKIEKSFLYWPLFILIFAPLASWLPFINGISIETYNSFSQTYTNFFSLTLCLSLLIPLSADLGLDLYVSYRQKRKIYFVGRYLFHIIASFTFVVLLSIFFCKKQSNNYALNMTVSLFSIIYAFYLYCIGKMSLYSELLKYGTKTYIQEEKEKCDRLKEESEKAKTAEINGETISL